MLARYARTNVPAAGLSYPHVGTSLMPPPVSGAAGMGYMHGGYGYPPMLPASDSRAMLYSGLQRNMHVQPRLSGGATGIPFGNRVEPWQGRPQGCDRDRDSRSQGVEARGAEARSRSRDAAGTEARRPSAAAVGHADKDDSGTVPAEAPTVQPLSHQSSDGRSEEGKAGRQGGGPVDVVRESVEQRLPSSCAEREDRQVGSSIPHAYSGALHALLSWLATGAWPMPQQ